MSFRSVRLEKAGLEARSSNTWVLVSTQNIVHTKRKATTQRNVFFISKVCVVEKKVYKEGEGVYEKYHFDGG